MLPTVYHAGSRGRALALDPGRMKRSGAVWVAAELAREYGVCDVDGSSLRPLTLDEA